MSLIVSIAKQWIPQPLKPMARSAYQQVKRSARRISRWLQNTHPKVDVLVQPDAVPVELGHLFTPKIVVTNQGKVRLSSSGIDPAYVRLRWKSRLGEYLSVPPIYLPFPQALEPKQTISIQHPIPAMPSLGKYQVDIDVCYLDEKVENGVRSPLRTISVLVDTSKGEDIDYHAFFNSFDLEKDYWTPVGPVTEADYHRLAKNKFDLMLKLGLTPDHHVLDVGCGTGQVATVLENYLSDKGFYQGTELAKAGVEFCQKKFKRPNFQFVQNDMTHLPLQGKQFDMAIYFSVFTHTYPEETKKLLQETKRLLAPQGIIFADLFTSPMVETYLGNRGAVENNYDLLIQMFEEVGLKMEIIMADPWRGFSTRHFFKLTHK